MLARLGPPWLASLIFLGAVGVAHAFVNVRYMVTSAAGAVMALLQSHLVDPASGLAVYERLADTVLGALLAWGFSYVLPSWEQRRVSQLGRRVLQSLSALTPHALHLPDDANAELDLRLARREVYDALDAVAAAAQRTRVEPERVRVPLYALATLLMHSHALLAQLAAVKTLLQRRQRDLDRPATEAALQAAVAEVQRRLSAPPRVSRAAAVSAAAAAPGNVAGVPVGVPAALAGQLDVPGAAAGVLGERAAAPIEAGGAPIVAGGALRETNGARIDLDAAPGDDAQLPSRDAALAWLQRRLRIAASNASQVAQAAAALQAVAGIRR